MVKKDITKEYERDIVDFNNKIFETEKKKCLQSNTLLLFRVSPPLSRSLPYVWETRWRFWRVRIGSETCLAGIETNLVIDDLLGIQPFTTT